MSEVSLDFASLRVSALRKASCISSFGDKVTIGPGSGPINEEPLWAEQLENKKNTRNVVAAEKDNDGETAVKKSPETSTRSSITFSVRKILLENELQRREEVRKTVEEKRRHMESSQRRISASIQLEAEMMRWILSMKRESEEAQELQRLEAEEERLAQLNETRRKHERQLLAQRIQERKEKLEREAEEHRKLREREELVNRIAPLRTNFREKCRDIGSLSKGCKDRNSAAVVLAPLASRLKELSAQMESISEKARSGDLTTADVAMAENVVRMSEEFSSICKSEIARIDAQYEEEIARREEAVRQAQAAHSAAIQQPIIQGEVPRGLENSLGQQQIGDSRNVESISQSVVPASPSSPDEAKDVSASEIPGIETDTSAPKPAKTEETDAVSSDYESLRMYMNTHVFLTNYAATYRELAQASSLKKFRFECQKATNIPVNAISGVNGAHLKEKYETLKNLLSGKASLNITQHPQGVAFCKDILAKKIVSQGETLISSKPEMAFPVAAVAVALWNDYPDFGELLLAHLRRTCPYILPVFLPRLQGQTNEEYYRSLGYKYNEEGLVEKQDKYLTRMSGLVRLYAAIIVTGLRRGSNGKNHPHGIRNAWRWLAVTLNTEARADLSDVCATLILDVLEVAGNSLWRAYPRQFPKLLMALATQYYPQMRNEAGIGGGPMARLEEFLKDCLTNRAIPPPEGQLPPNFW